MSLSGARMGRHWWVINAALLLIASFALTSCNSVASALSPTQASEGDNKIIAVLLLDENNEPILNGATIQVPGITPQSDDDDDDGYWLETCISGQFILVLLPGYETKHEPCATGKMEYVIKLARVTYATDVNYSWISAQNCRGCHSGLGGNDEYREWADHDGHSSVFEDAYFWTMYTGMNSFKKPGTRTEWEITPSGHKVRVKSSSEFGPGYLLDYPTDQGNCAYCHVPALIHGSTQTGNVGDLINMFAGTPMDAKTEGVTCDICHKVTDVVLGENGLPYSDRPGVLSLSLVFPGNEKKLVLGPTIDPSPVSDTTMVCSPVFSEGKFCAACHYGKFFDTLIYNSYGEWLESGYSVKETNPEGTLVTENENYRSCQDCHMLSDQDVRGTRISARDACSSNKSFHDFDHNMMKYVPNPDDSRHEQSTLIEDAASLDVKYQYLSPTNAIEIIAVVENVKAGHKLPTDSPLRHLLLVVKITDEQHNMLPLANGGTIPLWGGVGTSITGMENYGGMPGKIFAHLLADKDTNDSPTAAYWNPTKLAWVNNGTGQTSDNRLKPFEPDESRYSFSIPSSNGKVSITVKLVYRYAFIDLAVQKGWTRPDLEIASVQCTVNPKQPALTECKKNP